jgi:predicted nucleotidyltransferase
MFDIPNVTPRGFKQPVSETLPVAVARIAQALHPQKIILFGSYAYGNPTPDSDVDLLVVMDTTASVNERYLTVCKLLRPRPFPVDIVVKTPDELRYEVESNNYFIREVTTRGEVVYELGN